MPFGVDGLMDAMRQMYKKGSPTQTLPGREGLNPFKVSPTGGDLEGAYKMLIFTPMHIITQTPRLIIREFLPEEQAVYLHHFTDEEVCRHIPVRTTEERINIFQTALNNYATSKQAGIWGMFNKETGEFIGSCLLRPFNNNPAVMEIGYSMNPQYWGQGIATEMVIAMIAHSFANDNIVEVAGVTTLENIGSQRVLEKAGLLRVDNLLRDNLELAYFRLLKS